MPPSFARRETPARRYRRAAPGGDLPRPLLHELDERDQGALQVNATISTRASTVSPWSHALYKDDRHPNDSFERPRNNGAFGQPSRRPRSDADGPGAAGGRPNFVVGSGGHHTGRSTGWDR